MKQEKKRYTKIEHRSPPEIDPITGKRKYKKRNEPPKVVIQRVPGEYSNINVRKNYGL
jgi:hypothetical protein